MNLGEILTFVNFQVNKHQSGNTLNAEEYNACLKYANIEYMRVVLGLPESYQPGAAIPKIGAEQTEVISNRLKNFKVWLGAPGTARLPINKTGIANLPTDYVHYSSIRYEKSDGTSVVVEVLNDQFLEDRLSDSLKKPTLKHPVANIFNDKIMFYPNGLSRVHFKYYRVPKTPYYAVTISEDEEIYDPSKSIELEWPEIDHNNIVPFILEYVSNNLRDTFEYQNAVRRKLQGQ